MKNKKLLKLKKSSKKLQKSKFKYFNNKILRIIEVPVEIIKEVEKPIYYTRKIEVEK